MIDQSIFTPQLRVFRQLDQSKLTDEFKVTIGEAEGSTEWVDANRARDLGWTEEIMAATIGAALVDANGQFVKKFDGPDGFRVAEKARSSARVVFDYELPAEEETDTSTVPSGFEGLV